MASQSHSVSSPTAYDDSFRTILNDCKELVIPVVNEAFGESYTGSMVYHLCLANPFQTWH